MPKFSIQNGNRHGHQENFASLNLSSSRGGEGTTDAVGGFLLVSLKDGVPVLPNSLLPAPNILLPPAAAGPPIPAEIPPNIGCEPKPEVPNDGVKLKPEK